jgi:membrane protease YdiL (CAAX protease family)
VAAIGRRLAQTTKEAMQPDPVHGEQFEASPRPPRYGIEIGVVLAVSFGASGLYSLLSLINKLTAPGGLGKATATLNGAAVPDRQWLDFLYQVADVATGFAPALLALYLLGQAVRRAGFGIGLDLRRPRLDLAQGALLAAAIGIPGLGLYFVAKGLGLNATIATTTLPDVWYRYPILILSALQNATAEEVVVLGFVMTRLRQLGWSDERAIGASALLRGSYHLYQGFGGFIGNFVMGLVFGWWFKRTGRVAPMLISHFIQDAFVFVAYAILHGRVSWL